MKITPLSLCCIALLGWTLQLKVFSQTQNYTMHEWGTFTTVMGSDGSHLDGVEREDAPLPRFVYQLDDLHPVNDGTTKGLDYSRTLAHVNVRMETPVIYFYTDQAFDAQVDVEFFGGTIGQWFPDRSAGEAWPEERTLDYTNPRKGSLRWNVRVEPPGEDQFERVFHGGELPCWLHPRQTDSALVTNSKGETDKYLFYRGLGRLDLPLACTSTDAILKASSKGPETITQWLVFDLNEQHEARWWMPEPLAPASEQSVNLTSQPFRADWKKALYQDGLKFLMKAGLYRKEADAMLQTWWNDYFGKPGLRVFWLVPSAYLDKVLPLHISPTPHQSSRVMVGRAEILTPAFEKRLMGDFAQEDNGRPNPWQANRFFPAYANRVLQLREAKKSKAPEAAILIDPHHLELLREGMRNVVSARTIASTPPFSPTLSLMPGEQETPPSSTISRFKVHEWGTFTVLQGSNGQIIPWYQSPKNLIDLPTFVKRNLRVGGKTGTAQSMDNVRMETPVLYFYPEAEMDVQVTAGFPAGRITEVFPPAKSDKAGNTVWAGHLLPPTSNEVSKIPTVEGTTGRHYAAARAVPEAWLFRNALPPSPPQTNPVKTTKGLKTIDVPATTPEPAAIEHFVFYRGAGTLNQFLLHAMPHGHPDEYLLSNLEDNPISKLFAIRVRDGKTAWTSLENLQKLVHVEGATHNQQVLHFPLPAGPAAEVAATLRTEMIQSLVTEGLTRDEASAMVATWDDLWFTEPGIRILAILPQSIPDAMVPLAITPSPTDLERVFVARLEILTFEQEDSLMHFLAPSNLNPAEIRTQVDGLQLGRFAAGGLERAISIMSSRMRGTFREAMER